MPGVQNPTIGGSAPGTTRNNVEQSRATLCRGCAQKYLHRTLASTRVLHFEFHCLVTEKEKVASLKSQIALTDREIGDLEKRRERVLRDVGAIQSRMDKLPMREQQLASLTRDYEASKANYKSLLDKKLAAEMAANMERWQKAERFVMLDVARVPEKPTSPGDRP